MKFKSSLSFSLLAVSIAASSVFAATGDMSFTPTGFKIPVMKITISKNTGSVGSAFSASNEQTIYQCSSTTEANCLVDVTNQTALNAITSTGATVSAGTYDQIGLYMCADGKGGSSTTSAFVQGSFTVSSTNYYTDPTTSNANGISSSISGAGFTEIANWGCSTRTILLATPLVVTEASVVNATLLVENSFAAFSQSATSPGMGGCKAQSGGGARGVCITAPIVIPYVSTATLGTTTTQRYKISWSNTSVGAVVSNKANAIVVVPLVGTTPLMAYTLGYYTDTSAAPTLGSVQDATYGGAGVGNTTDPSTFTVNTDGSLAFSTGGSLDTNAAIFSAFKLSAHTGTATTRGGATWYYSATPY